MIKKNNPTPEEEALHKVYPGMINLQKPPASKSLYERTAGYNPNSVSKDDLITLVLPFISLLRKNRLVISPLSSRDMKVLVTMMEPAPATNKLLKDDYAKLYNSFALDITNIPAIVAADDEYKEAWHALLSSYDVDSEDFEDILGRPLIYKRCSGWGYSYIPEALFFPIEISAYSIGRYYYDTVYEYRFRVLQEFRATLTKYLFGADILTPLLTISLPDDENLKIENFEPFIANDLLILSGMALNGSMLNANGSIASGLLKKLKKQVEIKEFTPNLDEWPLDRVELLALTYFIFLDEKLKIWIQNIGKKKEPEDNPENKTITVKEMAKFAVEKMPTLISATRFNSFLPPLQGFNKTWTALSYLQEIIAILSEIIKAGGDAWQSLSNLRFRILCAPEKGHTQILKLFSYSDRAKSNLQRRSEKDLDHTKNIKPIDWFEEVGFRIILNWIKYLCALGLLEIAMENGLKSVNEDSLAGMRYIRLTPLGLYAFGLADDYKQTSLNANNSIEFDAENGIITLPSATSPYIMFLSTVARKISPVRFAISVDTIIKGCRTKADLENRIASLTSVVDIEAEPGLKKIVEEALGRTDCIEREGGYSLLRIRKHLPEITRLITNDKRLRQIVLPASRGMLLVKTANLDTFYNVCAAAGYLLT